MSMPPELQADIQRAWERAHSLLFSEHFDEKEVAALVADLRSYAQRVKSMGAAGERELLWLAVRLAGRTDTHYQPHYSIA